MSNKESTTGAENEILKQEIQKYTGLLDKVPTKVPPDLNKDELEQELQRYKGLLESMVTEVSNDLSKKNQFIRDLQKLLDAVITGVSHDLRTTLHIILGATDIIKNDIENERSIGFGCTMLSNIVKRITKRAITYEHFTNSIDYSNYEFTLNDINNMLTGVLKKYELDIQDKPIEVNINFTEPGAIKCDKKIEFVFESYIDNAIKSVEGADTKKIEIGYKSDGKYHIFYVKDSGMGIDKKDVDKIFSIHKNPDGEVGVGLGLITSKQIISRHGGKVWVESDGRGKGSTFYFAIPQELNEMKSVTEDKLIESIGIYDVKIDEEKNINALIKRKRVMIVDDEKSILDLFEYYLQKDGLSMVKACDGIDALTKIKLLKERYDLLPDFILLDIKMPKLSGNEVCRKLKSSPVYSRIPIYLFSGKSEYELKELVTESGADGYFQKPLDTAKLLDTIRKKLSA